MKAGRTEYFPAIDGLRAIAVSAVLSFHLGQHPQAGFVGVDIFFVISGFVVSGAALSSSERTLSGFLLDFYCRRMLRIMPALLVCLLISFGLMILFTPIIIDSRFTQPNVLTGIAAAFGLSNFVLSSAAGDYWSPRAEYNPFTHTWSLAVEEQFYLIAPLIMYALLRGYRRAAVGVLLTLAAISIALAAIWSHSGMSKQAFYLLPSRFWELAAGMGLYVTMSRWRPKLAGGMGGAICVVGGVLLVTSTFTTNPANFPWPWALFPVCATAMIIAGIVARPTNAIARLLCLSPIIWVGKRSYAIYLWHWPLIVIARWTVGIESPVVLLCITALTIVCAELSKRYVEDSSRRIVLRMVWQQGHVVAAGILASCAAVSAMAAGVLIRPIATLSATGDQQTWNFNSALPADGCAIERRSEPFSSGFRINIACSQADESSPTVYVAGDSHATAYIGLLGKLSSETGVRVIIYTRPGCPVISLRRPVSNESAECATFVEALLQELNGAVRSKDTLFLPGLRIPRYVDFAGEGARVVHTTQAERVAAAEDAAQRLSTIAQRGGQIIFEAPKPVFKTPPFRCSDWFNRDNSACAPGFSIPRKDIEILREPVVATMHTVSRRLPGSMVFDPLESLCNGETCHAFRDGKPLFFDADHLSGYGNSVLYQAFYKAIRIAKSPPV